MRLAGPGPDLLIRAGPPIFAPRITPSQHLAMTYLSSLAITCFLLLSGASGPGEPVPRPVDPWIFHTILDNQPGILVVALHESLWLGYDTASCTLHRVWRGGLLDTAQAQGNASQSITYGFTYNTHAPDPTRWRLSGNGPVLHPDPVFRGFAIEEGQAVLRYELVFSDGQRLSVEERPEYLEKKRPDNRTCLERVFTLQAEPARGKLSLRQDYGPLVWRKDLAGKAKWTQENRSKRLYDWGTTHDFTGDMYLSAKKPATVEVFYTVDVEQEGRRRSSN